MTIEVNEKQLAALVRGDAVSVGPSKRVITLDDGPFVVNRSYPAPHCGRPGERGGSAPRSECATGRDLDSARDLFQHIPKTKRWDVVRDSLDAIDAVHGIDVWEALPIQETRAKRKGASYHILERHPYRFMVNIHDEYGENTEISVVHEVGHHIDHWLLGEKEPYAPLWFSEAIAAQYGLSHHQLSVCGNEDMVDRLSGYSVQDFDEIEGSEAWRETRTPSEEVSLKGIYLWDAITDSQAYRALQEYKSGRQEIKPIPEDYFLGDRDNPEWVAANKTFDRPIVTDVPFSVMRVLRTPREVFARAYTQYISVRSGDKDMTRAINENIDFASAGGMPIHWEWDDFEPIANSFDSLFRSKGWLKE